MPRSRSAGCAPWRVWAAPAPAPTANAAATVTGASRPPARLRLARLARELSRSGPELLHAFPLGLQLVGARPLARLDGGEGSEADAGELLVEPAALEERARLGVDRGGAQRLRDAIEGRRCG